MKIVIIGNGIAGISAAESIRNKDSSCQIVMFSTEAYYHYSRPRVIEVLSGKTAAEQITIRKKDFYEKNNVLLHLSSKIIKLDVSSKNVILDNGSKESYDRLILAAGASSFLPPIEGTKNEGVFTLRTIDDAKAILEYSKEKKSAIVIGGGLLGIEAANSFGALGLSSTIVEVSDRLLPRQLDQDASLILQKLLEEKGIKFLLGKQTLSIKKEGDKLNPFFQDGSFAPGDIVLFSAGIRSSLSITEGSGIAVDKGIKINNYMETNIPGIYAAGDIAEHNGIIYGLWMAGKEQGSSAGLNAAGEKAEYKGSVPSTKLKVAGIDLGCLGKIESGPEIEVFTRQDKGAFKRIFIKERKLVGAILLGDSSRYQLLQNVMKSGEKIVNKDDLI
jgi:nitrite reductase (NADH) large subunit